MVAKLANKVSLWIMGGVFAVAAIAKILSFDAFVRLITASFFLDQLPAIAAAVGFVVVGVEAFLAALYFLEIDLPWVRRLTLATLVVFSAFLLYQVFAPSGQGCGCLIAATRSTNARHDAMLGLIRNAGLILLVVWLGWSSRVITMVSKRAGEQEGANGLGAKAFTLVEVLLVILVIGVLLAISLPTLAGSRRAAKESRHLSLGKGLAAAAAAYTTDFKGLYPNLGVEGQLFERPWVDGAQLPLSTSGYFKANAWFWTSLVVPNYFTDRVSIDNGWGEPLTDKMIATRFWMAHGLMASTRYWTGDDPGGDWAELRGQAIHNVVHPSRKGMLIFQNVHNIPGTEVNNRSRLLSVVAGCDGAAALRMLDQLNLPKLGHNRVVGRETAMGIAVLCTETGAAGIDY